MRIIRTASVLVAAGALLLTGCSSENATNADSILVTDQWAKAADTGMTAAFATLENTSGADITVVSAASPISDDVQLHEVVGGVMSEMDGGFVVGAGQSRALAPGADHIMLMDLAAPVQPGADVEVTLTFGDGTTRTFHAQAREFAGNKEDYASDTAGSGDHAGMDHGGMNHGS